MDNDELISQVFHKIEREKALIHAANAMRQSSNPQVQHSLDAQVREGRKNIDYLEERMRELQMRRVGTGMENMSIDPRSSGGPAPPTHGGNVSPNRQMPLSPQSQGRGGYPSNQGDYGDPGQGGYMNQLGAGTGSMPPKPPYGPSGPGSVMPKARPNYSKLGRYSCNASFESN